MFFPDRQLRYINHPELLAIFKPNQEGYLNLSGSENSFNARINEMSFRGSALENNREHLLILGDSFTFGWGVVEEKTFPALIQRNLDPRFQVVNGGVPGFGIWQVEANFRRVAPIVKPRLTIIVLWEGMFERRPLNAEEREKFIKDSSRLSQLKKISTFGTHIYRMIEKTIYKFKLDNYVPVLKFNTVRDNNKSSWFSADRSILERLLMEARASGSSVLFVLWPRLGFVEKDRDNNSALLEKEMEDFALFNNVPFISLREILTPIPKEQLIIPKDYHPTSLAHQVVAKRILLAIQEYHLLSSKIEMATPALVNDDRL